MDKPFQHDYAKTVSLFIQKMPAELHITAQEIDAYFRQCILYLMSFNEQMRSDPDPGIINQLYTEDPVEVLPEQIAERADYYLSHRDEGIAIPDFFQRILAADTASETRSCCEFIRTQQEVFTLYATFEATFSFEENRRLAFLNDQLKATCSKAGVMGVSILEVSGANTSQNTIKKLNALLEKSAKSVSRKRRASIQKQGQREDILKKAERIVREMDSIPASQKTQEETPSPNLSSGVSGTISVDDLLHGKAPEWVKNASKSTPQEDLDSEDEDEDLDQDNLEEDDLEDACVEDNRKKTRRHAKSKPTLEEALAELDGMIGLDAVKKQVESIVKFIKISKLREKSGSKTQPMSYHLVFSGNPGTGKTTVARIIADIYSALGILRTGQLVEVGGKDLVGQYVGKTETKTRKVIKKALGGVLFIDEAYLLAKKKAKGDYGKDAIGVIMKAMEDHRDDLVVIVAGYDKLMKDFIESNPGLKSRFTTKIFFEDYNGKQLYEIFESMVRAGGYRLEVPAVVLAKVYFEKMYRERDKDFGNGRDVRNSYEKLRMLQTGRLADLDRELTGEELDTFTAEDIIALTNTTVNDSE